MAAVVTWRGAFTNEEVNSLHAAAFGHPRTDDDWQGLVGGHSLGWATARRSGDLAGFVNVVWDGACHAWLQDLMVAGEARRQGTGTALVAAAREAAAKAGCEWLHVDFDEEHRAFYIDACGFTPAAAGLIALK
jgi:GNAT superfamily N-acetyltransferase